MGAEQLKKVRPLAAIANLLAKAFCLLITWHSSKTVHPDHTPTPFQQIPIALDFSGSQLENAASHRLEFEPSI